jgi:DNA-binding NarL/FixJ family response regulator
MSGGMFKSQRTVKNHVSTKLSKLGEIERLPC